MIFTTPKISNLFLLRSNFSNEHSKEKIISPKLNPDFAWGSVVRHQNIWISFILLSNSWILPVLAQEIMPPTTPWSGKSLELIANPTNPWITPAESSDLTESPDYTESMAWLEKLSQASPSLSINRIGTSEQGRMISVIIASSDQDFSASELSRSKKP